MLLPKFLGPAHLRNRPFVLLRNSENFRNSVIPNNSEPTNQRNFHVSTKKRDTSKYKGRKIEHTNDYVVKTSKNDIVTHFRNVEEKMKNTFKKMSPDSVKEREKGFWPTREIDEYKVTKRDPSILGYGDEIDNESERPYDDLNLNDDLHFSRAMSYVSLEESSPKQKEDEFRFPICETLNIGRHAQVTAGGRVFSFSALVMLGTGRGTGGLGYARANSVPEAIQEAKKNAEKNLISLDLWRGYHIGADIKQKYKKSHMFMIAHPPGYGRRPTAWDMDIVLDAFGISDVSIGWGGSRNKHTRYRAIFKALRDKTRSPEKVARMLGRKLFNRAGAFYHTYD